MASHGTIRVVLGMATLSVALLAADHVRAQTIAVAPFAGRRSSVVRRMASRALPRGVEQVRTRSADRVARRAGVEGLAESGVAAFAVEVGADLVLQGRISGRRSSSVVELLFRAADGTELVRGEVEWRRAGRRFRRELQLQLERLYEQATVALDAHLAPPPEPEPSPPEPAPEPFVFEEPPTVEEEPAAQDDTDGLALFAATAGLAIRTRTTDIRLTGGGRRRYATNSGVYPELLVAVEGRPFANDSHLGRGLFIRGLFAHSIGLLSETQLGAVVSSNFLRLGLHAGFMVPLGELVELGLSFGAGFDGYYLGSNDVLPDAEYMWLRPGVRARFRLMQETVVVELDAAYRAVLSEGELRRAFGEEGDAHGVDVGFGVGGNLLEGMDVGLTWAIRASYVSYFMSFDGMANAATGESGVEESIRVSLSAGYSFR